MAGQTYKNLEDKYKFVLPLLNKAKKIDLIYKAINDQEDKISRTVTWTESYKNEGTTAEKINAEIQKNQPNVEEQIRLSKMAKELMEAALVLSQRVRKYQETLSFGEENSDYNYDYEFEFVSISKAYDDLIGQYQKYETPNNQKEADEKGNESTNLDHDDLKGSDHGSDTSSDLDPDEFAALHESHNPDDLGYRVNENNALNDDNIYSEIRNAQLLVDKPDETNSLAINALKAKVNSSIKNVNQSQSGGEALFNLELLKQDMAKLNAQLNQTLNKDMGFDEESPNPKPTPSVIPSATIMVTSAGVEGTEDIKSPEELIVPHHVYKKSGLDGILEEEIPDVKHRIYAVIGKDQEGNEYAVAAYTKANVKNAEEQRNLAKATIAAALQNGAVQPLNITHGSRENMKAAFMVCQASRIDFTIPDEQDPKYKIYQEAMNELKSFDTEEEDYQILKHSEPHPKENITLCRKYTETENSKNNGIRKDLQNQVHETGKNNGGSKLSPHH